MRALCATTIKGTVDGRGSQDVFLEWAKIVLAAETKPEYNKYELIVLHIPSNS